MDDVAFGGSSVGQGAFESMLVMVVKHLFGQDDAPKLVVQFVCGLPSFSEELGQHRSDEEAWQWLGGNKSTSSHESRRQKGLDSLRAFVAHQSSELEELHLATLKEELRRAQQDISSAREHTQLWYDYHHKALVAANEQERHLDEVGKETLCQVLKMDVLMVVFEALRRNRRDVEDSLAPSLAKLAFNKIVYDPSIASPSAPRPPTI
ncbi:hypothetical protein ACLOJK_001776 [Asimina triloba]